MNTVQYVYYSMLIHTKKKKKRNTRQDVCDEYVLFQSPSGIASILCCSFIIIIYLYVHEILLLLLLLLLLPVCTFTDNNAVHIILYVPPAGQIYTLWYRKTRIYFIIIIAQTIFEYIFNEIYILMYIVYFEQRRHTTRSYFD